MRHSQMAFTTNSPGLNGAPRGFPHYVGKLPISIQRSTFRRCLIAYILPCEMSELDHIRPLVSFNSWLLLNQKRTSGLALWCRLTSRPQSPLLYKNGRNGQRHNSMTKMTASGHMPKKLDCVNSVRLPLVSRYCHHTLNILNYLEIVLAIIVSWASKAPWPYRLIDPLMRARLC